MSRSGYSADYDGDGAAPVEFYYKALSNAKIGKRGQKFFSDLVVALDAMREKRLITEFLEDQSGNVCALGALGKAREISLRGIDPEDASRVGRTFNIAECLARETVYENDENSPVYQSEEICAYCKGKGLDENQRWLGDRTCWACKGTGKAQRHETPEERWQRMRDWAASNLSLKATS